MADPLAVNPYTGTMSIFPAPSPYEEREEEKKTVRSGGGEISRQTREQTAALGTATGLAEQKTGLAEMQAEQDKAKVGVDVDYQQELGAAAQSQSSHLNTAIARSQDIIDKARSRAVEEQERLAKMPTPALFADRTSGEKLMLGIGLALAAFGKATSNAAMIRAGLKPDSSDPVRDIIEMDLGRQREAIAKQKDTVIQARTGISDAFEARKTALNDVSLKGIAAYKAAEATMRARLANLGYSQADIDKHAAIIKAKEEVAKLQADYAKNTKDVIERTQTTTTSGTETVKRDQSKTGRQPGTEDKTKSVNYNLFKTHGEWLRDNMGNLSQEDRAAVSRVLSSDEFFDKKIGLKSLYSAFGLDTEQGVSPLAKEFISRAREAADAKGRIKSGGAVNTPEEHRFIGGVTPRVSDVDDDIKMRQSIIDDDIRVMSPLDLGNTPGRDGSPIGTTPPPATRTEEEVPRTPSVTRGAVEKDSPEDVNSDKPLPEDDDAEELPEATKVSGKGGPVATKADKRSQAVEYVKRNPDAPVAKILRKKLKIRDEELE